MTPSAPAQARAGVAERNSTRAAGRGDVPRHALVTGGGSGIGLACAEHLAAGGYVVTIVGRRAPVLERAADRLRGAGRAVRWVAADVCDEQQITDAVDAAADGGALIAVVAAAGTGWVAPLTEIPLAAWHHVIDVNLTGTFLTLRAAAPHMAAAGLGSFVAISSVNAERTSRFHIPYCATKAGVDMLVRCAADELGHAGIRVNAVRPGLVPTGLSSTLVDDDEVRSELPAADAAAPPRVPRRHRGGGRFPLLSRCELDHRRVPARRRRPPPPPRRALRQPDAPRPPRTACLVGHRPEARRARSARTRPHDDTA